MRLKSRFRAALIVLGVAAAGIVGLQGSASAATISCDNSAFSRTGINICVQYDTNNHTFVGSAQNFSNVTVFSALITVTDQRTWANTNTGQLDPGGILEAFHGPGVPNGHACAALYVPATAFFPLGSACIN